MATATLSKGPLWMQNLDYTAAADRILIDTLWAVEGVLTGFVVAAAGGLNISIAAGQAIVDGDEAPTTQGKYLIDSDSSVNLLLAAVGADRTEYVYLTINDPAESGGRAGNNAKIETGASVPANSALLLATLVLPAGTATITAGMITDGRVITGLAIGDDSVTTAKIAAGAVGTTELADDSVTAAKIAAGAVGTTDIADGSVTDAKLASGIDASKLTTGTLPIARIADGAVTNAKLASGIDASKLTTGTMPIARIADEAVTEAKLAESVLSSAWTGPTYVSGWGAGTGGLQTLAVKKIGNVVFLVGTVRRVSGSSLAVGTLPAGFHPAAPVRSSATIGTVTPFTSPVTVEADGDVVFGDADTDVDYSINMVYFIP